MSQNKSSFPLILGICAVLVLVGAVLFTFKPAERKLARTVQEATSAPKNEGLERMKAQEFLGLDSATPAAPFAPVHFSDGQATGSVASDPLDAASGRSSRLGSARGVAAEASAEVSARQYPHTHLTYGQKPYLASSDAPATPSSTAATVTRTSMRAQGGNRTASLSAGRAVSGENVPAQKDKKSSLVPYLAGLSKEQAEAFNKRLDTLTDKIQAAVSRALAPKSKKEENIEKYLARHSEGTGTAQTAGKFASVARQISRQKAGIMQSMQEAFGDKAARQAGQLMDAYQNELLAALNREGLTSQQLQQQARQISEKYNNKLQELGKQSGLEKFKSDAQQQDATLQRNLATPYGEELAGQIGDVLAQYRQQELDLLQQPDLNAEDFFKQQLELQAKCDENVKNLLLQNNQPVGPYLNLRRPNQQTKENEEELPPAVYSQQQQDNYNNQVAAQTDEMLQRVQQTFGEEGRTRLTPIVEEYRQRVADIMASKETSVDRKNEQLAQVNREMNDKYKTEVVELQVNEQLTQMFQNPALAQVSAQERAELEQQARPILKDMYERAQVIMENADLTPAQREQQLKQLEAEAMRKLTGQ